MMSTRPTKFLKKEKTQELLFLSENYEGELSGLYGYAIENHIKKPIKISYTNDGKLLIKKASDSVSKETVMKAVDDFNKLHPKRIKNFIKFLENVPFEIFGDYDPDANIDKRFVFYDININENWLDHEDLKNFLTKFGFYYPKVFYEGIIDSHGIIATMKATNSDFKDGKIMSGFVKTETEFYFNKQRTSGIVYNSSLVDEKTEIRKKTDEIVSVLIMKKTYDTVTESWKKRLEGKSSPLSQNELNQLMSNIVNEFIFNNEIDLSKLSNMHNIQEDYLRRAVKKQLPPVIMETLKIVQEKK